MSFGPKGKVDLRNFPIRRAKPKPVKLAEELTPRENKNAWNAGVRRTRLKKTPALDVEEKTRKLGTIKSRKGIKRLGELIERSPVFATILGLPAGSKISVTVKGSIGKKGRALPMRERGGILKGNKQERANRLLFLMIGTLAEAEGKRGVKARKRRGTDEWVLAMEKLQWDISLVEGTEDE